MFQDLAITELVKSNKFKKITWIDVRSPAEFKEATIPNAKNIPVFTDDERAEIGTIYKQVSVEAAKEKGLEIFSAKLPAFIKAVNELEGEKVVFCWRGGMRSKTAATVVDLMGIPISRLEGGIRSYREFITEQLKSMAYEPEAFVLNGYTGSGKTKILRNLQNDGYPVLNLEKMANHRGSIFGQIGLEPNNQRTFEALLFNGLHETQDAPYVLFEAESQRIGKVLLPQPFLEKKENGTQIFLTIPIEERVKTILEDYHPTEHKEECIAAFQKIKRRIHTPIATEIEKHIVAGEFSQAVHLLFEYYYDPLYQYSAEQYAPEKTIHIEACNVVEATEKIRAFLHNPSKNLEN